MLLQRYWQRRFLNSHQSMYLKENILLRSRIRIIQSSDFGVSDGGIWKLGEVGVGGGGWRRVLGNPVASPPPPLRIPTFQNRLIPGFSFRCNDTRQRPSVSGRDSRLSRRHRNAHVSVGGGVGGVGGGFACLGESGAVRVFGSRYGNAEYVIVPRFSLPWREGASGDAVKLHPRAS